MKVTSLHVSSLFSFDDFALDLGDGLTVIVGPNGSGKTNVVRVLDLVGKLLDWADERSRSAAVAPSPAEKVLGSYVQAMHDGSLPGTPIDIRLGVEWTTDSERERIVAFVRAALLASLVENSPNNGEPLKAGLSSWVLREIDALKLAPLFKGTLTFRHPGFEGAVWEARYEFEHDRRTYDWNLYVPNSWASIVPHGTEEQSDASVAETKLWQALFDQRPNTSGALTLPDPLSPFKFASLCLPVGQRLSSVVVQSGTGVFSDQHEPFRTVANLLGLPAPGGLGQQTYGFARVMSICVREGLVVLGEQFRGLGTGGTIPWRAGIYPWESLAGPTPPRDPGFLPLRLFELKNGTTLEERQRFAAIQREFEDLAPGRSFDVTFSAATMPAPAAAPLGAGQVAVPGGDSSVEGAAQPGSVVTVVAWRLRGDREYHRERPIQLFGAGTWEALVLAEALVSAPGRLTVLDEPAVSLHPTWQTSLRHKLTQVQGQVLLVTHSPHLVPMETTDDLKSLVRMSNEGGASRCHRLPTNLDATSYAKITREFALSSDARSLLFCRGVIAVSGPTECGALPVWCSKGETAKQSGMPSDRDLEFYSVAGDSGFQTTLSVLHAVDIPWALVCDGKSFDIETNWSNHVFRQIEKADIDRPELTAFTKRVHQAGGSRRSMTQDLWEEQLELGARNGIFTLATNWSGPEEAIEAFFERVAPGKLAEAKREVGESKIRKGRWVAHGTPCPAGVDDLYNRVVNAFRSEANGGENPREGLTQPGGRLPT